jgi:RHS repeat-associated protein
MFPDVRLRRKIAATWAGARGNAKRMAGMRKVRGVSRMAARIATPAVPTPQERGFMGERGDASTGLQYLNARDYDPKLGRFIQPDWWAMALGHGIWCGSIACVHRRMFCLRKCTDTQSCAT